MAGSQPLGSRPLARNKAPQTVCCAADCVLRRPKSSQRAPLLHLNSVHFLLFYFLQFLAAFCSFLQLRVQLPKARPVGCSSETVSTDERPPVKPSDKTRGELLFCVCDWRRRTDRATIWPLGHNLRLGIRREKVENIKNCSCRASVRASFMQPLASGLHAAPSQQQVLAGGRPL